MTELRRNKRKQEEGEGVGEICIESKPLSFTEFYMKRGCKDEEWAHRIEAWPKQ